MSSILPATGRVRALAVACLAACTGAASAQKPPAGSPPSQATASRASLVAEGYGVVHSFAGHREGGHGPVAALAGDGQSGDALLGAAFFGSDAKRRCDCILGGTLFSVTRDGQVSTLHSFGGDDGIGPAGQLVQGGDGLWYGLTLGGGAFGHGTAFRIAGDGHRFEVLHSFGATPAEGSFPAPGPLARAPDGNFYGVTSRGGAGGAGTLFRMTPEGAVTIVNDFMGSPSDGADPQDQPIVGSDGSIYGTTTCGGKVEDGAGCGGTIYRLSSGAYGLLHEFGAKDGGYHPLSAPVEVDHQLFGTTSAGGAGDFGVLYRIEPAGTGFVKLHDFGGGLVATPPNQDGARPVGRLMPARDGRLYGTTGNGGPHARVFPAGDGTFFRISPTGDYEMLGAFGVDGEDAAHPVAGLVDGADGYAYGTTDNGGTCRRGTVFRFAISAQAGGNRTRTRTPASSPCDRRRVRGRLAGATGPRQRAGRAPARRRRRLPVVAALAAALCGGAQAQMPADMIEWGKAWSLVVRDFDGDGHDDILIAGHEPDDRIWYASPTGFRPGPQVLPWHDRHGCAAADVNRDGRPDLYCEIGAVQGTGRKANELWLQRPDGSFEAARNFGAEDTFGRGRLPVFLDLDHDGWQDLYITNDATSRDDGKKNHNRMFLNQRDGTFAETATLATGTEDAPGQPGFQCAVRGDIDGDGWDDLLVCNETGPGHLFINDRHSDFVELHGDALGTGWRDARLVDMDGDGRDDLVDITPDRHLQIWLNAGHSPWYVAKVLDVELPASGVSLATGDFDGDTRMDVYVVMHDHCAKGRDGAGDAILRQRVTRQWTGERLKQPFGGCGSLAATVDGTGVLLANGTMNDEGPNYVLRFGTK